MNLKHYPLQRNKYEQEIVDNSGQLWPEAIFLAFL